LAKKIAYGGILTALSLVILYLAFYLPTLRLTMYFFASIIPGIMLLEMGVSQAWILYGATSLLAFMLLGNSSGVIFYLFVFGLYPIVKYYVEKIKKISVEIVLKLLFFNGAVALIYTIWKKIFVAEIIINIPIKWTLVAVQPLFIFYDYLFTRVIFYYCDKISIKWRKNL